VFSPGHPGIVPQIPTAAPPGPGAGGRTAAGSPRDSVPLSDGGDFR
jgi:hypothetical protein